MASLSNTLLMFPRELPTYLETAYSVRYKDERNPGCLFSRILRVIKRTFALIKEMIHSRRDEDAFRSNADKLFVDFHAMNHAPNPAGKPLCIYLVQRGDHNGAILGDTAYYYHHYKIRHLQNHFHVNAQIVFSQDGVKNFINERANAAPETPIRFVDIVSHGNSDCLSIDGFTAAALQDDLFHRCAPDASILLDACLTGAGEHSIAEAIAAKNPGKTVLAPAAPMFFSKPVIQMKDRQPSVVSAVHGPAFFKAYTCKSFLHPAAP